MTRDEWRAAVIILHPSDTTEATAERRLVLDQAQAYRQPSWRVKPHGTVAAYKRHRREGERACRPCLDAVALDKFARRLARKKTAA